MSQRLPGLAALLVLILACGGKNAGSSPAAVPPTLPEEQGFLYRVDPARCLVPCAGDPRSHLVPIAADGTRVDRSGLLFEAAAQPALQALIAAAAAAGLHVWADSPFRDYDLQLSIWRGATEVGRSARPGHSEHQIGTAVDMGYDDEAGATWLADHAHEHGFALSYPLGRSRITGFRYEPWHFRWVGAEAAQEIHDRGWSVTEYLAAHPEIARSGDCSDCPADDSRSDCAGLDTAGRCDGTVLRWCYDGAAGGVDCSTSGLICQVDGQGVSDCR